MARQMREGLTAAIVVCFRTSFMLVIGGVLLTLLVPNLPLRSRAKVEGPPAH